MASVSVPGRRKTGRYFLYSLFALTFYFILLRPFLGPSSSSDGPLGSTSAGSRSSSDSKLAPLYARTRVPDRVPLPPGVAYKTFHDHPIERGLLKVDPESQLHPIYQLIRDGRDKWDEKVARQSKTLKEAVSEYRKRYKRAPPRGFDKWWAYVWYVK